MELLLLIIIIILLFGYIILLGVMVDYYAYKRKKYKEMLDKYMKESENDENEETNDNDRG